MAPRTARARCYDRMSFVCSSGGTGSWAVGPAIDTTHVSPVGRLEDGDECHFFRKTDNDTWSVNLGRFRPGASPVIEIEQPFESSDGGDKPSFPALASTVLAAFGHNQIVAKSSHGLLTNAGVLQGLADLDVFLNPDSYTTAGEAWIPVITDPGDPDTEPDWDIIRSTVLTRQILEAVSRKALQPLLFNAAPALRIVSTLAALKAIDGAAEFNNGDAIQLRGKTAAGDEEAIDYVYNAASTATESFPDVVQFAPGGTPQTTGRALRVGPTLKTAVGDAAYTVLVTDRFLVTSATLTAPRTLTLPAANAVLAGTKIHVADIVGAINGANTWTIAAAGSDTINGLASLLLGAPYASGILESDGVSKWAFLGSGIQSSQVRGLSVASLAFVTLLAAGVAGARWRLSVRQDDDPETSFLGEISGDTSAPSIAFMEEHGNLDVTLSGTSVRLQNTGGSTKTFSASIERLI